MSGRTHRVRSAFGRLRAAVSRPASLGCLVLCGCTSVSWLGGGQRGEPDPGGQPETPPIEVCPEDSVVTWESFAESFITTRCLACHTENHSGTDRQGAPEGIDFDSYEAVVAHASRVAAVATGSSPTMPPADGVEEADRARLAEWLACGTPGVPEPVDPCATLISHPGDVVLDRVDAVEEFCGSFHNAVEGDLEIRGFEVSCLCEVGGDLTLSGRPHVSAPRLSQIGGDLVVSETELETLDLPVLETLGGSLVVEDNPDLESLDLPLLEDATSVLVTQNHALLDLSLPRIDAIDDLLQIEDNEALLSLDLYRLEEVGGDVWIRNLPLLDSLAATDTLAHVGGDLVLTDLDSVVELGGFALLASLGGDLDVHGNDVLARVSTFNALTDLGGQLLVVDNPTLQDFEGLQLLLDAPGVQLTENPALRSLSGLINLETVTGDVILEDAPELETLDGLQALVQVGGDLRLLSTGLTSLPDFDLLASVGGDVVLRENDRLGEVTRANALLTIGGRLVVQQNPALLRFTGFRGTTDVDGGLVIRDNAQLGAIDGLSALERVGAFELVGHTVLATLGGLDALQTVSGDMTVEANRSLESLLPLHGMSGINGDLMVIDNAPLTNADATLFGQEVGTILGAVTISGNGP